MDDSSGLPADWGAGFREIAEQSGVLGRSQTAPDVIDLIWLKIHCGGMERVLRDQYMDPKDPDATRLLPPDWERMLAQYPPTNTGLALQRYGTLKHFYMVRSLDLTRRSTGDTADDRAMLAAYQLLNREPIPVDLTWRTVFITDRSLAALVEIARHESRVRKLWEDIEEVRESKTEAARKIAEVSYGPDATVAIDGVGYRARWARHRFVRGERNRIRKKVAWLFDLEERMLAELNLHRKAIYAHVFTENGAPAGSLDEAPEWWPEILPVEDVMILEAVNYAGAGRFAELGDQPEEPKDPDEKGRWELLENFGWLTTTQRWGIKVPIIPASFIDRPLGQAAAMFRLSRDPVHIKGATK